MIEGKSKKVSALLAKTWKKSFDSGIFIPMKMRFCNECTDILICNRCNNQINKYKELESKIYFLLKDKLPASSFLSFLFKL